MNLAGLYRDHPELAEVILGPPVYLASCHDCGQRFPPAEMIHHDSKRLCFACFDRRQDSEWQDWLDRLAKESR